MSVDTIKPLLPVRRRNHSAQKGFSLIEMMVAIAVLTIIMGAVFGSINRAQQTSASEQAKLDLTQQAREFMDQLTRDMRNTGYPNFRNTDPTSASAQITSANNAPGIIYVDYKSLWFAGDVDGTVSPAGTAVVKIVRYDLDNNGPNCPCLRRTEYLRTGGDPYADASNPGTAVAQMEIQGVQNGTTADPIFTPWDPIAASPVTTAVQFVDTLTAQEMAKINSIKVVLAVQAQQKDYTGAYPVTRVTSTIALSNCSEAYGGQTLSC